jgi:hypothetical protein
MTKNISLREWEALSAFLDNQLNEKDRRRLEARLKQDADLQEALSGLRQTRAVLRSQPKVRAPRNFTLTPAMVGQKSQARSVPRTYPMFRMASALATLLFVFFFVGDLFSAAPAVPPQDFALTSDEMERRAMAPPGYGGVDDPGVLMAAPAAESRSAEDAAAAKDNSGFGALTAPEPDLGVARITEESFQPYESVPADAPEGVGMGMGGGIEGLEEQPLIPSRYRLGIQVSLLVLAIAAGLAAYAVRRTA